MANERPKFLSTYLETIKSGYDEHGIIRLIPYYAVFCSAVGGIIAYNVPDSFFHQWGVSTTVYVGSLTFNGLILALSWNAFSRIHSCLLEGEISSFLFEKKLLNRYLFYIDYAHKTQMLCVAASGLGLVLVILDVTLMYERIMFGVVIAMTMYATQKAANCVIVMQDLIYQKAIFDHHHRNAGKVTSLRGAE